MNSWAFTNRAASSTSTSVAVKPAVADVFAHGAFEEMGRLEHDAELGLQPMQAALTIVDAVDQELALRRFVEAADQ